MPSGLHPLVSISSIILESFYPFLLINDFYVSCSVPYDELKRLEIDRRNQNINFKARLVNQGEYRSGAGYSAKYGGGAFFTDQQVISGNMGIRCNNW